MNRNMKVLNLLGISPTKYFLRHETKFVPKVNYKQGQIIDRNIREYFYYIDFQGRLFLDNLKMKNFTTAFRDPQFLSFFFEKLKRNDTSRYEKEFPFLMICGRERNFARCQDTPIVFTQFVSGCGVDQLTYNHVGSMGTVGFSPSSLYVNPVSGRLYHPAWESVGNIGLITSAFAQQFADDFIFANGSQFSPTHFKWKGERLKIDLSWTRNTSLYGINSVENAFVSCVYK